MRTGSLARPARAARRRTDRERERAHCGAELLQLLAGARVLSAGGDLKVRRRRDANTVGSSS